MRVRMSIDGALRRFLNETAGGSPVQMTDDERVQVARLLLVRALETRVTISGLPNGVETRNVAISDTLAGRLYTPPSATTLLPVLVYLHGGGWVVGSTATHDP